MSSSQFPNFNLLLKDFATCVCLSDIWYKFIFLCICALAWNVLPYCQNARFGSCWLAGRLATSSAAQLPPPSHPLTVFPSLHHDLSSLPMISLSNVLGCTSLLKTKMGNFISSEFPPLLSPLIAPSSFPEWALSLFSFSSSWIFHSFLHTHLSIVSAMWGALHTEKTSCQHKSVHFSSFQSVPWWRGATTNCCHLNVLLYRAWWRSERQFCWIESKFSLACAPIHTIEPCAQYFAQYNLPNTLSPYQRHPSWRWPDEKIFNFLQTLSDVLVAQATFELIH